MLSNFFMAKLILSTQRGRRETNVTKRRTLIFPVFFSHRGLVSRATRRNRKSGNIPRHKSGGRSAAARLSFFLFFHAITLLASSKQVSAARRAIAQPTPMMSCFLTNRTALRSDAVAERRASCDLVHGTSGGSA